MGQYHAPANLDKQEFIHPHTFGDGLKLMEWGISGDGTAAGLVILLASANKGGARGGGDLHGLIPYDEHRFPWDDEVRSEFASSEDYARALLEHVVGRWAGDRIAVIGDYHEDSDVPGFTDRHWGTDQPEDTDDGEKTGIWAAMMGGIGWCDISSVVIDALELDGYVRQERHKEQEYEGREMPPRARLFGGYGPETLAKLHPDGHISTFKNPKATKLSA